MESRSFYEQMKATDAIFERVRNEPTVADFPGTNRKARRAQVAEEKRRLKKSSQGESQGHRMSIDHLVSVRLQGIADGLSDGLGATFGEGVGFMLLIVPFNRERSELQYVSNVSREQAKAMLDGLLTKWQEGMPDVPFHAKQ